MKTFQEFMMVVEALDKDFASMRKRGGRSAPPEERSPGGERNRNNKDYWADVQGQNRDRGKGNRAKKRAAELGESAVPGKPAERLGAVTAIPQDEREAARQRILAKVAANKKKRGEKGRG